MLSCPKPLKWRTPFNNNFVSLCPIGIVFHLAWSPQSVCSTIHPKQSSRSEGSFPNRSGLEVLQISEISENSESAEVGDTVEDTVGERSLIPRSKERHRYIRPPQLA